MISRRKHIAASACYHWQMITFHYSAKLFSINNLHINKLSLHRKQKTKQLSN